MKAAALAIVAALAAAPLFVGASAPARAQTWDDVKDAYPPAYGPACPDDGRLKGVRVGSKLYRETVFALPGHACVMTTPKGPILVTVKGLEYLK